MYDCDETFSLEIRYSIIFKLKKYIHQLIIYIYLLMILIIGL